MARLIFIMGCTASGKGTLGRELALRVGGEILSVDSMKVYRRMDIGTAKPSAEVRGRIPHHLLDVVEPSEEFSVAEFVRLAEKAIADISARGQPILAVGGTPLYIKALSEGLFEGPGADAELRRRLEAIAEREGTAALHERLRGVDPKAAERLHPNDLRRLVRALEVHELTGKPISSLQEQWDRDRTKHDCVFIALRWEKEIQSRRINERVRRMIAAGLVEEVRGLLAESKPLSVAARQALGYAEIIEHLCGRFDLDEAIERIKINTRQMAKSQRTWLRRFRNVNWIDLTPEADIDKVVDEIQKRIFLE
ncbi:MAG: tRNA (adenosine(37)-N6)-dimethylallyltransferase MiaA [Planctomycetes bacterium]|nr:tRNA (adenosine(37)-N6)-dimethylallyltransferase MiaA [Planctomycetota bacterium]MBI3833938.1 tRNA (adenosine(37)-N6)-dimethylallyltransferase MiaA [Planctomycetota bacterium]